MTQEAANRPPLIWIEEQHEAEKNALKKIHEDEERERNGVRRTKFSNWTLISALIKMSSSKWKRWSADVEERKSWSGAHYRI